MATLTDAEVPSNADVVPVQLHSMILEVAMDVVSGLVKMML